MSDLVVVSVAVENESTAWSLGRTVVERGWASSAEVTGPARRIDRHHGVDQMQEVWRLSCLTVADKCGDAEALIRRVINRRWVEVTITPLLSGSGERPVDA